MSKVSLTSGRKTVKVQSKLKEKDMSRFSLTAKVADVSKYNLRCNRHISEKMTKKDFIYDIPRLVSCTRKICPDADPARNTVIPKRVVNDGGGDASTFPTHRPLNFECNFCHEPIATLFSLSTHVKFHRRTYCKKCYWILEEDTTMEYHDEEVHKFIRAISTNP